MQLTPRIRKYLLRESVINFKHTDLPWAQVPISLVNCEGLPLQFTSEIVENNKNIEVKILRGRNILLLLFSL